MLFRLWSLVKMVESIALFQISQKFHQIIGIDPFQPNQRPYRTKWTRTFFIIFCTQLILTTGAFLVIDAKSIFEYGYTFCGLISMLNAIVNYFIFIWQSEDTLNSIGNCEAFIEKSELKRQ